MKTNIGQDDLLLKKIYRFLICLPLFVALGACSGPPEVDNTDRGIDIKDKPSEVLSVLFQHWQDKADASKLYSAALSKEYMDKMAELFLKARGYIVTEKGQAMYQELKGEVLSLKDNQTAYIVYSTDGDIYTLGDIYKGYAVVECHPETQRCFVADVYFKDLS